LRHIFENAKLFERPKGIMADYLDTAAFQSQKEQFSKRWGAKAQDLNATLHEYSRKSWVPIDQVEGLLREIEEAQAHCITSVEDQHNLVKLLRKVNNVDMYPQILKSLANPEI